MFTLDGVREFHRWTHASLNIMLAHVSTIPASDYAKTLPNFGFPSLRDQVVHIFNCEGFWIHTLQGLTYVNSKAAEFPAVADAKRLQQETSLRTHEYFSTLTDQRLNAETELHFSDGDVALRTPAHVIHHFLTHAFHHKGQIVAMCRALGHPAPDTDLSEIE